MRFRITSLKISLLALWMIASPAQAVPILGLVSPAEDRIDVFLEPPRSVDGIDFATGFPVIAGTVNLQASGGLVIGDFSPAAAILGCTDASTSNDAGSASLSFTCFSAPLTSTTLVATLDVKVDGPGSLTVQPGSALYLDGVGLIVQGEALPTIQLSGEIAQVQGGTPPGSDEPTMPEPGAAILFGIGLIATRSVLARL